MGGTWETQNKVLPGAYVNIRTNKPLAITPGDRGVAVLPLELSVGTKGNIYVETALSSGLREAGLSPTEADMKLINEALKSASKVIVYLLGTAHTVADLDKFLEAMLLQDFNTIGYPYTVEGGAAKIIAWTKAVNADEGKSIQSIVSGTTTTDSEYIINVANGYICDKQTFTAAEACAWVAGATAGARITDSLTNKTVQGATDVQGKLTKAKQIEAVKKGDFIFKVDSAQNVTVLYDINTLTTYTPEKSKDLRKNRVMRVSQNIVKDITTLFESGYMGKVTNGTDERLLFKSVLLDYGKELARLGAIEAIVPEDIIIDQGIDKDSVVATMGVTPLDSMEKLYLTANLN